MVADVATKTTEGGVMAQEMEFLMYGLIVLGIWVIMSVVAAICWSLWNWKVGPPPPPPIDYSKWTFKYTETAPPARAPLDNHWGDGEDNA